MFEYDEEVNSYLAQIKDLVSRKRYAQLRDLLSPMAGADIALLLEELGEAYMPMLYRLLPKELAAEVFVELEPASQEMLINGFSNTELKEVLDELYLDDAADLVEEMPANVVIRILDKATPEMRKSINEILKYPEDSAGSIMTMEFLSLKKDVTVSDAFKRIRRVGGDMETINILYVTDKQRRLLGGCIRRAEPCERHRAGGEARAQPVRQGHAQVRAQGRAPKCASRCVHARLLPFTRASPTGAGYHVSRSRV